MAFVEDEALYCDCGNLIEDSDEHTVCEECR